MIASTKHVFSFGAVALLAFARADAMPGCGKREPMVAKAGDSCGGPFVCNAPTTCATLDRSIKMPSWESAYVCTKGCAADADCDGLGIAMKCTGMGRLQGYSKPSEQVCIPVVAQAPTP
jgi:hypothetical protein